MARLNGTPGHNTAGSWCVFCDLVSAILLDLIFGLHLPQTGAVTTVVGCKASL